SPPFGSGNEDDDGDGVSDEAESLRWTDPRHPEGAPDPSRLIDSDADGLSDFEETLLGFNPHQAASSPNWAGGDLAHAVALLSSGQPFRLGEKSCLGRLPSPKASARFLMQATLGATT